MRPELEKKLTAQFPSADKVTHWNVEQIKRHDTHTDDPEKQSHTHTHDNKHKKIRGKQEQQGRTRTKIYLSAKCEEAVCTQGGIHPEQLIRSTEWLPLYLTVTVGSLCRRRQKAWKMRAMKGHTSEDGLCFWLVRISGAVRRGIQWDSFGFPRTEPVSFHLSGQQPRFDLKGQFTLETQSTYRISSLFSVAASHHAGFAYFIDAEYDRGSKRSSTKGYYVTPTAGVSLSAPSSTVVPKVRLGVSQRVMI